MKTKQEQIQEIEKDWLQNPRWNGVKRPYSAEEVL
jgi:isocitrate lyase